MCETIILPSALLANAGLRLAGALPKSENALMGLNLVASKLFSNISGVGLIMKPWLPNLCWLKADARLLLACG